MAKNEYIQKHELPPINMVTLAAQGSGTGAGSGGDADTVDGFHASATAQANTLLATNAASKIPADITGDAATVDGYDATDFLSPQYVVIALDGNLSAERVLTAGDGIDLTDGGAGSTVTMAVDEGYAFTWTDTHTFESDIQADCDLDFVGAQAITTTSGDLTIAPTGDILLDPSGDGVTFANWGAGKTLQSSDYSSQTTGWSINYGSTGGHADLRSIFADELHVKAFIADIYQAFVGGVLVTKSRGRLSRDFTIPADAGTGTLYVEDLEGWENTQLFAASDIVLLRYIDSSGGGLIVSDVWGTVSAYSDLSGGEQSYTFTTTDDGGVDGNKIYAGAIALDYGQPGSGSQGIWEATVLDGTGAPYSQIKTWATNPWTPGNWTIRGRFGNLNGIFGVTNDSFGLAVGDYSGSNYMMYNHDDGFILEAGGGVVSIDGSGVQVELTTAWGSTRAYQLVDSGGVMTGGLGGSRDSTTNYIILRTEQIDDQNTVDVKAQSKYTNASNKAFVRLIADQSSGTNQVSLIVAADSAGGGDGVIVAGGPLTVNDSITATDYIVALGGLHVGGTGDPGTDNLLVDGYAKVTGEIRQGATDYGAYEIQTGGQIYCNDYGVFMGGVHVGGTSDPGTNNLIVDDQISVGTSTLTGVVNIYQHSTGGAACLRMEQDDLDQPFMDFRGTATSGNISRAIVDKGDEGSSDQGGWLRIYITDDGNQVGDGYWYIPFYWLA